MIKGRVSWRREILDEGGLPLRLLLFIIIISHSSSSTSHSDGSSVAADVRDGDLRNRAFVRFVPLARAENIGVFRDAQRSPQASASSGKKTRVTGAYSYEGRSAEVTRLGSSLSPLTFASFNVANDARSSSLILRIALHRR